MCTSDREFKIKVVKFLLKQAGRKRQEGLLIVQKHDDAFKVVMDEPRV